MTPTTLHSAEELTARESLTSDEDASTEAYAEDTPAPEEVATSFTTSHGHLRKYPVKQKCTALQRYLQTLHLNETHPPSPTAHPDSGRTSPTQRTPTSTIDHVLQTPRLTKPSQWEKAQASPTGVEDIDRGWALSEEDENTRAPSAQLQDENIHRRANYYKARIQNTWRPGNNCTLRRYTDSDDIAEEMWSQMATVQFEHATSRRQVSHVPTTLTYTTPTKPTITVTPSKVKSTAWISTVQEKKSSQTPAMQVSPPRETRCDTEGSIESSTKARVSFFVESEDTDNHLEQSSHKDEATQGTCFDDLFDYDDYSKAVVDQDIDFFPVVVVEDEENCDDVTRSLGEGDRASDVVDSDIWVDWSTFDGIWTHMETDAALEDKKSLHEHLKRPSLGLRVASAPLGKVMSRPVSGKQGSVRSLKSEGVPRPVLGRVFSRGKQSHK